MIWLAVIGLLMSIGCGVAALVRGARILHESEQDDDR
jgi:hypothetical protein